MTDNTENMANQQGLATLGAINSFIEADYLIAKTDALANSYFPSAIKDLHNLSIPVNFTNNLSYMYLQMSSPPPPQTCDLKKALN